MACKQEKQQIFGLSTDDAPVEVFPVVLMSSGFEPSDGVTVGSDVDDLR